MGVFTEYIAACPACGGTVSFQTSGDCHQYSSSYRPPVEVMEKLDGESAQCDVCEKVVYLRLVQRPTLIATVEGD